MENSVRWYAVQTKPRHEERVETLLRGAGVEVLLPKTRRMRRRRVLTPALETEALFPRYLFVRCNVITSGRMIRYTRGIVKMLGTPDGPLPVDEAVIDAIQARIGGDGYVVLTPSFRQGDKVRVVAGPLKDFVGIFHETTSAAARVKLLLLAISGTMRVVVDAQLAEVAV